MTRIKRECWTGQLFAFIRAIRGLYFFPFLLCVLRAFVVHLFFELAEWRATTFGALAVE
jgi:hypothetical protein